MKKLTLLNLFLIVNKLFSADLFQDEDIPFFTKLVTGFISRKFDPERGHTGIDFAIYDAIQLFHAR